MKFVLVTDETKLIFVRFERDYMTAFLRIVWRGGEKVQESFLLQKLLAKMLVKMPCLHSFHQYSTVYI